MLFIWNHIVLVLIDSNKTFHLLYSEDLFSLWSACVAHSTMGRWISGPPTLDAYSSVWASSIWLPAWSICSSPFSDSSFLCSLSMQISGMSDINNKIYGHIVLAVPLCKTMQLNKIKQSTLNLVGQNSLDQGLLNHSYPEAQKSRRILFSLLPWDVSLISIDQSAGWKLLNIRLHARQGHVMALNPQMNYTLPFDFKNCVYKRKNCLGWILDWVDYYFLSHSRSNLQKKHLLLNSQDEQ